MSRCCAVASAALMLFFGTAGEAQTPPQAPAPKAAAPAKAAAKKPAARKTNGSARQPAAVESGPCKLGVIPALGDRFSVHKFGLTVFETEDNEVAIEAWGLDDLAVARARAAFGTSVRRINYAKRAFDPFYHPKSRFIPDPNEGLLAVVRNITQSANCERYLVVTRYTTRVDGTNLEVKGIGTYNRGLGTLMRHSHLFANVAVTMFDGSTYERSNRTLAAIGAGLAEGLRLTEDPLKKLDNALYPDPPQSASGSAVLREKTRALVSAQLDRAMSVYLQE